MFFLSWWKKFQERSAKNLLMSKITILPTLINHSHTPHNSQIKKMDLDHQLMYLSDVERVLDNNKEVTVDMFEEGIFTFCSTELLVLAIRRGRTDFLKLLFNNGIDPNTRFNKGCNLLDVWSVNNGCNLLHLWRISPKMFQVAIEAGADVNFGDNEGRTPLMLNICRIYNINKIAVLLRAGADPYIMDNNGENAMSMAKNAMSMVEERGGVKHMQKTSIMMTMCHVQKRNDGIFSRDMIRMLCDFLFNDQDICDESGW